MREKEMRGRVESFLQTRLRRMLAPATFGLGLAMAGGCGSNGTSGTQDGSALADATGGAGKDSAPCKCDGGLPPTEDAAVAEAGSGGPGQDAQAVDTRAATGAETGVDTGVAPDAGEDGHQIAPMYLAQAPDAALDLGPVLKYMAPLPDAGAVAMYMARLPTDAGRDLGAVTLYMALLPPS